MDRNLRSRRSLAIGTETLPRGAFSRVVAVFQSGVEVSGLGTGR